MKEIRVYLDNCCYNRPYDDQSQVRISLESQAKLEIQDMIKNAKIKLVTSYMTEYENAQNPIETRRKNIALFQKENENVHVMSTAVEKNKNTVTEIENTGVKHKDAIHITCAMLAEADYLISTDDRLLKYQTERIHLVTPIEFLNKWEEIKNDDEYERRTEQGDGMPGQGNGSD